jgi:hypothetical protein
MRWLRRSFGWTVGLSRSLQSGANAIITVAINGSRFTGNHHQPRCPRVHLHRVVPSVPSIWMGQPLDQGKSYRPQRSHASADRPPIEAGRPIDEGDDGFTSAGTLSTGGFRRLDAASTLSAPQSRLAMLPSPPNPAPSPSLSQSRAELRLPDCGRERLASLVGAENARNGKADQRRTTDHPFRWILSAV